MAEGQRIEGRVTVTLGCATCPSRETHIHLGIPVDATTVDLVFECAGCGRTVKYDKLLFETKEKS